MTTWLCMTFSYEIRTILQYMIMRFSLHLALMNHKRSNLMVRYWKASYTWSAYLKVTMLNSLIKFSSRFISIRTTLPICHGSTSIRKCIIWLTQWSSTIMDCSFTWIAIKMAFYMMWTSYVSKKCMKIKLNFLYISYL
jgi:hypothetical protein